MRFKLRLKRGLEPKIVIVLATAHKHNIVIDKEQTDMKPVTVQWIQSNTDTRADTKTEKEQENHNTLFRKGRIPIFPIFWV